MYVEFFRLRELPFNNTPDPRFFVPTSDHEEALASLIYAVNERKGFVLLTGEVGAGKTLVSRLMLRHFGSSIVFANINHGVQTGRDLLEAVCSEFELNVSADASLTQLVRALHDFLLDRFAQDMPVVLVLDEAQNLPVDAFEQLRMIGNLEADDAKLLQIAIVGQPELQTLFASPQLRQLRQRVFRSFHLPALDRTHTEAYIRHRLLVAGAPDADLFASDAIDRIHDFSGGLPRLINTVCDNALLSAYSADRRTIDGAFLASVVEQMMQCKDADPRRSAVVASHAATDEPETARPPSQPRRPPTGHRIAASSEHGARARRTPTATQTPEPTQPDRACLIRSARRELDALRAALHGPVRGAERTEPALRGRPESGADTAGWDAPQATNESPAAQRGALPPIPSQAIVQPEWTARRLQSLVEQAERSSAVLLQREENLRRVARNVEGLASELRELLGRYHRTVDHQTADHAAAPRPRNTQPIARPSDRATQRVPEPRAAAPVESTRASNAEMRARRLARTLHASRENLARLRTVSIAQRASLGSGKLSAGPPEKSAAPALPSAIP